MQLKVGQSLLSSCGFLQAQKDVLIMVEPDPITFSLFVQAFGYLSIFTGQMEASATAKERHCDSGVHYQTILTVCSRWQA